MPNRHWATVTVPGVAARGVAWGGYGENRLVGVGHRWAAVRRDSPTGLDRIFAGAVTAATGAVTFLGSVGTGILLFVTAIVFALLGRRRAEDGAAKHDMQNRWNRRKDYR
jgi:hypothetical protein